MSQAIITVKLEKKLKNGKLIDRWYDIFKYNTGYSVQKNGRTLNGYLDGLGSVQILNECIESDINNGWEEMERIESLFYNTIDKIYSPLN